jgi:hypothetical protein
MFSLTSEPVAAAPDAAAAPMAAPVEDAAAVLPAAAPPAAVPVVVPPVPMPLGAPVPVVAAPAPPIPAALTTLPDTAALAPPLPVQAIVDAIPGGQLLPDHIPLPHDMICEGTAWSAKATTDGTHRTEHATRPPFWADAP